MTYVRRPRRDQRADEGVDGRFVGREEAEKLVVTLGIRGGHGVLSLNTSTNVTNVCRTNFFLRIQCADPQAVVPVRAGAGRWIVWTSTMRFGTRVGGSRLRNAMEKSWLRRPSCRSSRLRDLTSGNCACRERRVAATP